MATKTVNDQSYYAEGLETRQPLHHSDGRPSERLKRKRNRVPVACFTCRVLKTKCDGSKPVCSTCVANGEECQYSSKGVTGGSSVVMVNQEYLRSLEQRLSKLEYEIPHSSTGFAPSPNSEIEVMLPNDQAIPSSTSKYARTISSRRIPVVSEVHPQNRSQAFQSSESSMLVLADLDVFMGGVSFTQLILNSMNGRTLGLRAQSSCCDRDESFLNNRLTVFELPEEARALVHQFFEFHHQLSPIFHEPTMHAVIEDAINCSVRDRHHHRHTLAIMNMMFAVCLSHRLIDKNTNPAISRRYYDIAMELLKPTLLCDWSIEKVQALLLGARYLQCSNAPDECWNVLGLAIRIAYGLELHRPPAEDDTFNVKEMKKRIWYACFTLDKLLSMIYGRPAATSFSEFTCPFPEDLDDDCIYEDRMLYPRPKRASGISFSIEVSKLYCILESATRLSDIETASGEALAQSVLSLDEKYQKWYSGLPPQLRLDDTNDEDKPLILALRANMVRILIHRPSLALSLKALSVNENDDLSMEDIKGSILCYSRKICVKTAIETINLVSRRHEQTQKKSGTSWFNLYYLLNAILILVSHVVDPAYHADKSALAQLDTALSMIKSMSRNHTFAQKAYSFLQQLLDCMDKTLSLDSKNWEMAIPNQRQATTGLAPAAVDDNELFTLFDFTQDLTETYSSLGSEMWLWSDEQGVGNDRDADIL